MDTKGKIIPFEELAAWRGRMRDLGRRVVCTNGVFDLLHCGHVDYLARAAAFGDVLLVCVNDDAGVTALKGPSRPLNPSWARAAVLAGLESVGAVTVFPGERATEALRLAAPDVYVKGGDYTEETLYAPERDMLKAAGTEIRFIPFVDGFSTTGLVDKMTGGQGARAMFDVMFHRRSIRRYKPTPVSDDMIRQILKGGMAAPSARAAYPWHFVLLGTEARKAVSHVLPNGGFLADAPAGIVLCGDISRACGGELSYMIQDCSAAMENMLLAASALGLGACWLGVHPRKERMAAISTLLKLPEEIIPVAAMALGFPAEDRIPNSRFVTEAVHHDVF